jgi:acetylornithine deacetylase
MNSMEEKVLNAIDVDGMLSFLCKLIAIPSLDGSEGEVHIQEVVARRMRESGMDVDMWDIDFDELRQHPAFCVEVERPRGLGVVGAIGSGKGPTLILNGHTDVVPADDPANWHYPPWEGTIAYGSVYGRGAVDMKGGLCSALFAAKALREANAPLRGRLLVEAVIGEEDGGCGTLASILHGYRGDAAIITEPTEMVVVPSQAGALNFRITVPGRSAHGAMRTEGVSAIEKFIFIHQALMELEKERNRNVKDALMACYPLPYAINIGNVHGGNWASSAPESVVFEGRFGVAVDEEVSAARRVLENTLARAASQDPWLQLNPPRLEWWGGQFSPGRIATDHPVVTTVSTAFAEVHGSQAAIQGVPYGADMRLLVNNGQTPTILFGPGDVRQSHRPDEFVPVEDMVTVARTLALTALRFLQ